MTENTKSKAFLSEKLIEKIFSKFDDTALKMHFNIKSEQEYLRFKEETCVFIKTLNKKTKKKIKELLREMLAFAKNKEFIGQRSILMLLIKRRFGEMPLKYMEALDKVEDNSLFSLADKVIEAKSIEEVFNK